MVLVTFSLMFAKWLRFKTFLSEFGVQAEETMLMSNYFEHITVGVALIIGGFLFSFVFDYKAPDITFGVAGMGGSLFPSCSLRRKKRLLRKLERCYPSRKKPRNTATDSTSLSRNFANMCYALPVVILD
jgi:hypothetical protein